MPVKQQETFLERVNKWKGVSEVGHIEPDANNPDTLRLCFVQVEPATSEYQVIRQLKRYRAVEDASIQPERYAAAV
jgi:hypothetical protein